MSTKKRKGKVISVDFTGVEAGSAGKHFEEGPTKLEIIEIEEKEGQESGEPYQGVTFKVVEGPDEGGKVWDNFSMQPQALWKFRGFLDACGIETEDGPMDIDPDELVGTIVIGDIVNDEHKGKPKNVVSGYSPVTDTGTREEDDKPRAGVKKKLSKKKDEGEEWGVKQRVAFMDGKKRLEGVITELDGQTVTVRVGKEEYEMSTEDLEAA